MEYEPKKKNYLIRNTFIFLFHTFSSSESCILTIYKLYLDLQYTLCEVRIRYYEKLFKMATNSISVHINSGTQIEFVFCMCQKKAKKKKTNRKQLLLNEFIVIYENIFPSDCGVDNLKIVWNSFYWMCCATNNSLMLFKQKLDYYAVYSCFCCFFWKIAKWLLNWGYYANGYFDKMAELMAENAIFSLDAQCTMHTGFLFSTLTNSQNMLACIAYR